MDKKDMIKNDSKNILLNLREEKMFHIKDQGSQWHGTYALVILCGRRLLTFVNISRLRSLSTDLLFLEEGYYRFPSGLQ